MINLYDNFLSKEDFSYIKENILDNRYFPWYHNDYKVTPEDNIVQFTQTTDIHTILINRYI